MAEITDETITYVVDNQYHLRAQNEEFKMNGLVKPEFWNEMGIKVREDIKKADTKFVLPSNGVRSEAQTESCIPCLSSRAFLIPRGNSYINNAVLTFKQNGDKALTLDSLKEIRVSLEIGSQDLNKISIETLITVDNIFQKNVVVKADEVQIPICILDCLCGQFAFPLYRTYNHDIRIKLANLHAKDYSIFLHFDQYDIDENSEEYLKKEKMISYPIYNIKEGTEYIHTKDGLILKEFDHIVKALMITVLASGGDINIDNINEIFIDDRKFDFIPVPSLFEREATYIVPLSPGVNNLEELREMMVCKKQNGLGISASGLMNGMKVRLTFKSAEPATFVYSVATLHLNQMGFALGMSCLKYST